MRRWHTEELLGKNFEPQLIIKIIMNRSQLPMHKSQLRLCTLALILVVPWMAAPMLAALPLDQRPALTGEWGYRPADGAVVALNPPSFTWIAQSNAAHYTVQWSPRRTFSEATTIDGIA